MPYVIPKQPKKKKSKQKDRYRSKSDNWSPSCMKKTSHQECRNNDQPYCYPSCNYNTNAFPFYAPGPPNVLIPPGFGPTLPWAPYSPPLNIQSPPAMCYESPLAAYYAQTRGGFPVAPPIQLSLPAQPGWLPINYQNNPFENQMIQSGIVATNPPLQYSRNLRNIQAMTQMRI